MSAPDKPRRKRRRSEHEEPRETGAPVISGDAPGAVLHRAQDLSVAADVAEGPAADLERAGLKRTTAAARDLISRIYAATEYPIGDRFGERPSFILPDDFPDDLGLATLQGLRAFLAEVPGRRVESWAMRDGCLFVVAAPDAQKRRFRL